MIEAPRRVFFGGGVAIDCVKLSIIQIWRSCLEEASFSVVHGREALFYKRKQRQVLDCEAPRGQCIRRLTPETQAVVVMRGMIQIFRKQLVNLRSYKMKMCVSNNENKEDIFHFILSSGQFALCILAFVWVFGVRDVNG